MDLGTIASYPMELHSLEQLADAGDLAVFLSAGATGFANCEADPIGTRRINVDGTCDLAERLMIHGAFVVFLSSTAVFGSGTIVAEDARKDPSTEYGRQKAVAETYLLDVAGALDSHGGLAIVRLAKVVAPSDSRFEEWIAALGEGSEIEAATDVYLSPVSLEYVTRGLTKIAAYRTTGIFHLFGERTLSYYDFALELARSVGASVAQVIPARVLDKAGSIVSGSAASLSMRTTTSALGIEPQTVGDAIRDLISGRRY